MAPPWPPFNNTDHIIITTTTTTPKKRYKEKTNCTQNRKDKRNMAPKFRMGSEPNMKRTKGVKAGNKTSGSTQRDRFFIQGQKKKISK